MTDELDTLVIDVRANTQGFAADVAQMRGSFDAILVDGFGRAGDTLERGLLGAIRRGSLGFEDLRRVALNVLGDIAAQAALQRGVLGDEGTGRQAVAAAGRLVRDPDRQGARLPLGRGDDHRDEAYGGALRRGLPPARVRLRRGTRHRSSTVRPPGCAVADPAYRGAGSPRVNAAV